MADPVRPRVPALTRRRSPGAVATALAASVWAVPGVAWPCPSCYSAGSDGLLAYLWTAVLLSLLPLAMIGGIVLTVRRRLRTRRHPTTAASESPTRAGPAGE